MSDGYEPSAQAQAVYDRLVRAASDGGLGNYFEAYLRPDLETLTIRLPTGDRLTLDASPQSTFFTMHNRWGRLHASASQIRLSGPQFTRLVTSLALPYCRTARPVPLDRGTSDSERDGWNAGEEG